MKSLLLFCTQGEDEPPRVRYPGDVGPGVLRHDHPAPHLHREHPGRHPFPRQRHPDPVQGGRVPPHGRQRVQPEAEPEEGAGVRGAEHPEGLHRAQGYRGRVRQHGGESIRESRLGIQRARGIAYLRHTLHKYTAITKKKT